MSTSRQYDTVTMVIRNSNLSKNDKKMLIADFIYAYEREDDEFDEDLFESKCYRANEER